MRRSERAVSSARSIATRLLCGRRAPWEDSRELFLRRDMGSSAFSFTGIPVHPQKQLAEKYDQLGRRRSRPPLKASNVSSLSPVVRATQRWLLSQFGHPLSPKASKKSYLAMGKENWCLIGMTWACTRKTREDRSHSRCMADTPCILRPPRSASETVSLEVRPSGQPEASHMWWQGIDPGQAARHLGKEAPFF